MEDNKGILIVKNIWTIKNLNINEKLIVSDIYQKSLLDNFNGYNKKIETLSEELGLNQDTITEILKTLVKKGYITREPLIKRNQGKFKTVLPRRFLNMENIKSAERFSISEDNIFFRNGKKGVYIIFSDIRKINSWYKGVGDKKRYSTIRNQLLMLFLILKKISYINEQVQEIQGIEYSLMARFTIEDIAEFMGITRKTIGLYLNGNKDTIGLTQRQGFGKRQVRLLYRISDDEVYKELIKDYGLYIGTRLGRIEDSKIQEIEEDNWIENIPKDDSKTLYYINYAEMMNINLDFSLIEKI